MDADVRVQGAGREWVAQRVRVSDAGIRQGIDGHPDADDDDVTVAGAVRAHRDVVDGDRAAGFYRQMDDRRDGVDGLGDLPAT